MIAMHLDITTTIYTSEQFVIFQDAYCNMLAFQPLDNCIMRDVIFAIYNIILLRMQIEEFALTKRLSETKVIDGEIVLILQ
jgi:hypothetical protein